jgi:hypothetical protein
MPEKISSFAKVLIPVAKALSTKVRRVYKEHQAGKMPFEATDDLLENGMEETIHRLVNGKTDDVWWKKTLDTIGHKIISPEFLRIHAVREWLSAPKVQTDFKVIARDHIMGKDDYRQETLKRLRQTYADKTGEDERLADAPVEVIVAIITAGYFGSIRPEIEPVVGMIQDHARETNKAFHKIDNRLKELGPDNYAVQNHNNIAQKDLYKLLKRRSLKLDFCLQEIVTLTKRIFEGDLSHADNSIKSEILYWTARLHASQIKTLPLAKKYLENLYEINPGADARIVDALMCETKSDVDGALRILRDIDNQDGRATFFIIYSRQCGEKSALLWFDEHPNHEDPGFFTGIGWAHLAITLAKNKRWTEAAERIYVVKDYSEQWPDLAFVEGVVNAALLLPDELRCYALEMNLFHQTIRTIEGSKAELYRAHSKLCFEKAYKLFEEIDLKERAQAALDWHLWLRLTDPGQEISQNARKDVSEGMKVLPRAIDLINFARTFQIEFDEDPLKQYIDLRKRTGGLEDRELFAEFLLAELKMSSRERADYIRDEEKRLSKVVSKAAIAGLLVESLVEDGQTRRAREILEERKADFIDYDYQRVKTLIDTKDGADPRARLENLYDKTSHLLDLKNLISHLKKVGDWDALQPRLEELFKKERTVDNALKLIWCFRKNLQVDYFNILTFLDENDDLVNSKDDLLSEKAWALAHTGRLVEADLINTELLKKRVNQDDLELKINIALQSGDWDRFSLIINNAMSISEKLRPKMIIRLASLAAEVDADPDRAFKLLELAVDKGPDDPQILIQAYMLAVQLGRENKKSGQWIARAIDLSTDDGPLLKVDIRTVAEEMMPSHRENARDIEQALMKGEISLQAAANIMGQSLSSILVEIPKLSADLQDGRRRTIVPIRSGSRGNVEVKSEWKVCFDTTSIMVLNHLNLLEKTVDAFKQIVLAPDTMIFLLIERRRARFHQPSQIKRAEDIRSLLYKDLLKTIPSIPDIPKDLTDEVGGIFAELLVAARTGGGLVVRPFPIYKSGSFMEREAELQEYADYIISTKELAKVLYEKGMIDLEAFDRAHQYLSIHDHGRESNKGKFLINCPLYLDDLSLAYLQHVNLLNVVCNSDLELFVHPSTLAFQSELIEEDRGGIRLSDRLNNIRIILRKALENGKATFLSRPRRGDKDKKYELLFQIAPTIANIMEDTDACDAVCIDDRYFNKHRAIIDKKDRSIPVVCVTDILQHLATQDVIHIDQMYNEFYKLRQAGFAFIPIPLEELKWSLDNARWDQDGFLIESAEMRVMRQILMRIRSLDMLVLPEESAFLEQIQLGCVIVIRNLWLDESASIEKAIKLSNWIWHNIAPCPVEWVKSLIEPKNRKAALEGFARHHSLLLKPIALSQERYDAYLKWLEDDLLEPLLSSNVDLIDAISDLVTIDIELMIKDFYNDESRIDG